MRKHLPYATTRLVLPAILLALLRLPSAARAQTFTLEGYILDSESKAPVSAALVELKELKRRAFADSLGFFSFPAVREGHYTLVASSLGYSTVTEAADFAAGFTPFMLIPPRPVLLKALVVTVDRLGSRVRASGFSSQVFSPRFLASAPETTVDEFLREYGNVQLVPCTSGLGGDSASANARGRPLSGSNCLMARGASMPARVYVDENPQPAADVLETFRTGDVARVEVFRGLSMIRIYTPAFLERVAKGKAFIDPVCLVCTAP